MHRVQNIAPRVLVYSYGAQPPSVPVGWLALAQLDRDPHRPPVFGDGSHPTTRLCAAAVDLLCRRGTVDSFLDVGTGSGIQSRIARARGARVVVATDIDPDALICAAAHAALDVTTTPIHFSSAAPDCLGRQFSLVVANILNEPLRALACAFARALSPGGVLLISGFTRLEISQLNVCYADAGFRVARESTLDEWALLMLELAD